MGLCFQPVFTLWDANHYQQPRMSRPALIAAIASVVVLLILRAVTALARRPVEQVAPALAIGVVAFFNWAPVAEGARAFLGLAIAVAIAASSWMLGRRRGFKVVAFGLVFSLTVPPVLGVGMKAIADEKRTLSARSPVRVPARPARTPDVYFVVLDSMARADVLRDLYGFEDRAWEQDLEEAGFFLARNAVTNFSMTYASIPSALNMDYVLAEDEVPTAQSYLAMQRASAGDNALARVMRSWGYRWIQVEGGTTETRCGPSVDDCREAPFLDEPAWTVLERTPLRPALLRRYGAHTTQSSLGALSQLEQIARATADTPRFVFAHVLLPHPPLHLRADCSIVGGEERGGTLMRFPWMTEADVAFRKRAYVEQTRCLRARLRTVIEAIPRDAVVVLMGDHGPDSYAQVIVPPSSWTEDAARERMGIEIAVRAPGIEAALPDVPSPVNLFRAVLSAAFGADVALLPTRSFAVSLRSGDATAPTAPIEQDVLAPRR